MIQKVIDSYLLSFEREVISDKFHCSDAGRCLRMRYWKRQGIEKTNEIDERTRRVFAVGNNFHNWVQHILSKENGYIGKEIVVEDEHRRGHVDLLISNGESVMLYDIKTVHSKKFSYISKETDKHYHFQVLTYYLLIPEDYRPQELKICYVSKDDLRIAEVDVDKNLLPEVNSDWEKLFEFWNSQRVPPPFPYHDWECKYCNYKTKCFGENF